MIKPVFLSASQPDPLRSAEYWNTRKLLNAREAVRAFCAHALRHYPVVFGGHPAITPLVRAVAERLAYDAQLAAHAEGRRTSGEAMTLAPRLLTFQSGLFVERPSSADEVITDSHDIDGRVAPPRTGMRNESLLRMRYEMIATPELPMALRRDGHHWLLRKYSENFGREREAGLGTCAFSAAVFIGGMEGVVREFRIFRSFHPHTPAFPIASTGSACFQLLSEVRSGIDQDLLLMLQEETAYSLLMQKILPIDAAHEEKSVWPPPPPDYRLADHCDPEQINARFLKGERM